MGNGSDNSRRGVRRVLTAAAGGLAVCIALTSCAALGTETTYRSPGSIFVENIGVARLEAERRLDEIHPTTSEMFSATMRKGFETFGLPGPVEIPEYVPFGPDSDQVAKACKANNLDGLIVTKLVFARVNMSVTQVATVVTAKPVVSGRWRPESPEEYLATHVEMKLFNNGGVLLVATRHYTFSGNTYFETPPPSRTIRDATIGAFKQMAEEMGLKKRK